MNTHTHTMHQHLSTETYEHPSRQSETHTRTQAHTHTSTTHTTHTTYTNTQPHKHTHTRTHTHTHTHNHTNTQIHKHTNTQTHKHTHTHKHTQTHKHTNTQTHKHANTQTHKHTSAHTHSHMQIRTQSHIHTHTQCVGLSALSTSCACARTVLNMMPTFRHSWNHAATCIHNEYLQFCKYGVTVLRLCFLACFSMHASRSGILLTQILMLCNQTVMWCLSQILVVSISTHHNVQLRLFAPE